MSKAGPGDDKEGVGSWVNRRAQDHLKETAVTQLQQTADRCEAPTESDFSFLKSWKPWFHLSCFGKTP